MANFVLVADYELHPAEGIQVVSKTLADGLRLDGHAVRVVPPRRMPFWLPRLVVMRHSTVVFTHGPGIGVVVWSILLRFFTGSRIIWVATRPDLSRVPAFLLGRRSAHAVIGNSRRREVDRCAPRAEFYQQFIGIDPERLAGSAGSTSICWPELNDPTPTALHVGHLRNNRGLDLLIEAKHRVGERGHIVVLGSPTFPPDPGVIEALTAAGVLVRREYVANLASLYSAVDLYLFPVRSEVGGAIDLPLGVLEAVACGTPVVSTPFGSLPEALAGVPGVGFAEPAEFAELVERTLLGAPGSRKTPDRLPDHLHARQITSAVLHATGVTQ